VAFSISLVVALLLVRAVASFVSCRFANTTSLRRKHPADLARLLKGLSPGARDFFDRWTLKDSQRKVNYKKAVTGMLLVLVRTASPIRQIPALSSTATRALPCARQPTAS
jgi:hypothetical protein